MQIIWARRVRELFLLSKSVVLLLAPMKLIIVMEILKSLEISPEILTLVQIETSEQCHADDHFQGGLSVVILQEIVTAEACHFFALICRCVVHLYST